jgi:hypothetical protein
VFRPRLAEYVATAIKKGAHVLVDDIRSTRRRGTPHSSSFNPIFIRSKAWLRGWEEERVRAEERISCRSTEVLKRGWGKQQEVLRRMNRSGYRPKKWRGAES